MPAPGSVPKASHTSLSPASADSTISTLETGSLLIHGEVQTWGEGQGESQENSGAVGFPQFPGIHPEVTLHHSPSATGGAVWHEPLAHGTELA